MDPFGYVAEHIPDFCFYGLMEVCGCSDDGELLFRPTLIGTRFANVVMVWPDDLAA